MKKRRWEIVFEDDHLVVINKPAPYLTIPDRYDRTIPSLVGILSERREQLYINHRLDKETSGLIVFTKSEQAHKTLSADFERREIEKLYYTIVMGQPTEEIGLIDLPILQSNSRKKGMIVSDNGKESQTKYRIIESYNRFSFLEINLLTGRQHQIRVHMRAIGCPIVCDRQYGDGKAFYLSQIKRKMNRPDEYEEKPLLSRVALHAHSLKFKHPATEESMKFSVELPKDMKAVIHQLGKWG